MAPRVVQKLEVACICGAAGVGGASVHGSGIPCCFAVVSLLLTDKVFSLSLAVACYGEDTDGKIYAATQPRLPCSVRASVIALCCAVRIHTSTARLLVCRLFGVPKRSGMASETVPLVNTFHSAFRVLQNTLTLSLSFFVGLSGSLAASGFA